MLLMTQTSSGLGFFMPAKQAHPKKLHSLSRIMNLVAWKLGEVMVYGQQKNMEDLHELDQK